MAHFKIACKPRFSWEGALLGEDIIGYALAYQQLMCLTSQGAAAMWPVAASTVATCLSCTKSIKRKYLGII